MKRLGIMADIQGVQENKKKLIIKCRHISPPPVLNQITDPDISSHQVTGYETTKPTNAEEDVESNHSKINQNHNK